MGEDQIRVRRADPVQLAGQFRDLCLLRLPTRCYTPAESITIREGAERLPGRVEATITRAASRFATYHPADGLHR
jgi:hypothetical protein